MSDPHPLSGWYECLDLLQLVWSSFFQSIHESSYLANPTEIPSELPGEVSTAVILNYQKLSTPRAGTKYG